MPYCAINLMDYFACATFLYFACQLCNEHVFNVLEESEVGFHLLTVCE